MMNKALDKAFGILEVIAEEPERPKRLGEIATRLELNQATCAHILKNLMALDYVEQVSPRQGYLLGPKVYYLARGGAYRQDLVTVASPTLTGLVGAIQETVVLASYLRGRRYLLDVVEARQEVQINRDLLYRDDIYQTATGWVLLAHQSASEVHAFVQTHGVPADASLPTETALQEKLAAIRQAGYCEQYGAQAVQVAVPIFEGTTIAAALGATIPITRYPAAQQPMIQQALIDAATQLRHLLTKGGR
jgi:IclR family KDG regulon transcriptional repressor